MVYLDTIVFLYPVIYQEEDPKARRAKHILLQIARGDIEGCTATLSWDELVWVTRKVLGERDAIEQGRKFLAFPNLKLVAVDSTIIMGAQKIIENFGLKPRDALHASAALESGQSVIMSDDDDFDAVKGLKRVRVVA